MLSISAFGQTGLDRSYPGYAPLFGAAGGLGYLTGYSDGPPVEIRHVMDHSVGMTGAFAALAALLRRRYDGRGQHVDLAACEVASALIGDALVAAAFGEEPARCGNASETMAPHNVYPCRGTDAWLSIAVSNEAEWRALASVMGRTELAADPRFRTCEDRLKNVAVLDEIVAAWTSSRDADDAARELQALGISAVPSWNAAQLANDVHLRARGTIVDLEVDGAPRAVVGSLVRFSKSSCGLRSGTPALGEHNDYVFGDLLGISRDKRRLLERERVIY
jgi:crotonobetainyl-CoA:carnitine CoA-transferase CaiB-like acyl-CoA transferase